jgi:hypothetical protein
VLNADRCSRTTTSAARPLHRAHAVQRHSALQEERYRLVPVVGVKSGQCTYTGFDRDRVHPAGADRQPTALSIARSRSSRTGGRRAVRFHRRGQRARRVLEGGGGAGCADTRVRDKQFPVIFGPLRRAAPDREPRHHPGREPTLLKRFYRLVPPPTTWRSSRATWTRRAWKRLITHLGRLTQPTRALASPRPPCRLTTPRSSPSPPTPSCSSARSSLQALGVAAHGRRLRRARRTAVQPHAERLTGVRRPAPPSPLPGRHMAASCAPRMSTSCRWRPRRAACPVAGIAFEARRVDERLSRERAGTGARRRSVVRGIAREASPRYAVPHRRPVAGHRLGVPAGATPAPGSRGRVNALARTWLGETR